MKNFLLLIALVLFSLTAGAQTLEGRVTVKVNETATITLGSTYNRVLNNNATGISYRWYSNSTTVATVSYSRYSSCTVTGKSGMSTELCQR